ncbi:transcription factor IIIb subunit [Plasmodium gonderi]|uniref:B-related factor 1 n=1 Tax=Plasmodium gonderi TaxID=77519 RepID=A0A1Y1JRF9_PLAGO|nr:transcription factor IIIb subunit [Plasmodium gonderi]GAW82594.1 transcription factor IIIb subunit [Plasmodium gonderi]
MLNQIVCQNCNSTDVETNEGQGEVICLRCGSVLEENKIVESLEFVENNNGAISMVGQFVPSSGNKSFILSWGVRESREISLQKGYINIQKIADQLHLSTQYVESAQRIYLMALQRNFTMGRNNSYVAASCLYTICRREKSPVMLIDFSDILQTPVKPLGKTFMKLLRLLHINVPNIDPSLYLERFAHKLNLKNDIYKVTYTGIKLIQAMARDWICTGRRPTGLCGAALLISTRMHGIFINSNTIANIVRISNPTIVKRLSEFKNTSTAKMKVSDFDKIHLNDIPSNSLPPCVIANNRRKFKRDNMIKNKTLSLCDSEDICSAPTSPAACDKTTRDSEQFLHSEEKFSPNCNEDTVSLHNTMNSVNEYDADDSCSYNNLTLLDGRSSCNGLEDITTTGCSVNGGCTKNSDLMSGHVCIYMCDNDCRQMTNQNIHLNMTLSSRLSSGKIARENETEDGDVASSFGIDVEEICNENPEGNDIDELAKKIISKIDVEKQSNIFKMRDSSDNNNNAQFDSVRSGCSDNMGKSNKNEKFSDGQNEKGSIDNEAIVNEAIANEAIENESIANEASIDKMKIKNERNLDQEDKLSIKSTLAISSTNRLSELEHVQTTEAIISKNLTHPRNICENKNSHLIPHELENNSRNVHDHAFFRNALNSNEVEQENIINLNPEPGESIYHNTLKETLSSELSNILNDVDEFNILGYGSNREDNYRNNEKNSINDDTNNASSILSDFNYIFGNNSNIMDNQDASVEDTLSDDGSIDELNESLSDFYDSEIEGMILSEKERKSKMLIWDDMMKTRFPQYFKQLKKQKKRTNYYPDHLEEKNIKKKKKENDDLPEMQSTGDSVIMALQKSDKNISSLMNYDVLKSLFSS